MTNYTSDHISVTLPEHLSITELAGKLPTDQVQRMVKPYKRHVDVVCQQLADVIDITPEFTAPEGIATELREASTKARDINDYVLELEAVLKAFKQQRLLYNNQAYKLVRQINTMVNSQAVFEPRLVEQFTPLIYYFNKNKSHQTTETAQTASSDESDTEVGK